VVYGEIVVEIEEQTMKISKHLVLIVLTALLLGACSSSDAPTVTQTPTQEPPPPTELPATSAPTETPTAPQPTATEPPPTPTDTETPEAADATQDTQPPTNTPVPTDVFSFLEVGPDEWVRGPADAPVTIIEYADFQ
jgi:preprotein translocase subunit SecD